MPTARAISRTDTPGIPAERLQEIIERTFRYFFDDPWNGRFRRLLLLSQFAEPLRHLRLWQAAEHLLGDVPGAAPPLRAVDRADLHALSLQA